MEIEDALRLQEEWEKKGNLPAVISQWTRSILLALKLARWCAVPVALMSICNQKKHASGKTSELL